MIAAVRAPLGALAEVFRTPDLRRLELAYASSLVALWGYSIAIAVFAYDRGGPRLVGLLALLRLLPALVVAPLAAVLADRHPRRLVLAATDLARAALLGLTAVAAALDLATAAVVALAAAVAVVSTAFEPAKNAIVPSLVSRPDQLTAANVATSTFEGSGVFIGPALGGLLLAAGGAEVAFAVMGVLFGLSASMVLRIRRRDPPPARPGGQAEAQGLVDEALAGVRVMMRDRRLRLVVGLYSAQVIVAGALTVFVVVIALELLETGNVGVGLLDSAAGLGGIAGSVVALALAGRRGLGSVFGLGIILWGIPLALVPVFPSLVPVLLLMAVIGLANTVVDSAGYTLIQRTAPEEALGRVFGAFEAVALAALALGGIAAAALVDLFGNETALAAAGLFPIVFVLAAWPALRRLDSEVAPAGLGRLRKVPIFASLAAAPLEQLAGRLERVSQRAGDTVIKQGDVGDRFYVIESGEVRVIEDGRVARHQGPGESFGEIALLRDVPRTATVVAATDVELWALDRAPFVATVTGHVDASEEAERVIAARLGSMRAAAGAV